MNEDFHPPRVLCDASLAGPYAELFAALEMPPPWTHPVRPSDEVEEQRPARTLDWLFHRFMGDAGRVVSAMVRQNKGRGGSDHLPVLGVYEL